MKIIATSLLSAFYGFKDVTHILVSLKKPNEIEIPDYLNLNDFFDHKSETLNLIVIKDECCYTLTLKTSQGLLSVNLEHNFKPLNTDQTTDKTKAKVALMYVYSEFSDDLNLKTKNIQYFLTHNFVTDIEYRFVINGEYQKLSFPENLKKNVLVRENVGYDYGGYIFGCNSLDEEYDYYIFINDSCVGPFINPFIDPNITTNNWVNYLIDRFNDDTTGILGSTINLNHYKEGLISPHVQGYMFMLNKKSYLALRTESDILSKIRRDKDDVIIEQEIGLSSFLLKKGFAISSLLYELNSVTAKRIPLEYAGDCLWKQTENIGRKINPFETIFVKNDPKFDNIDHSVKDYIMNI